MWVEERLAVGIIAIVGSRWVDFTRRKKHIQCRRCVKVHIYRKVEAVRNSTLDRLRMRTTILRRSWGITTTLDRKNRTRTDGSKGIRPDTVNDRVLATISLDTPVRRACSLS